MSVPAPSASNADLMTSPTRLAHDPHNSACWPIGADEFVTPVERFFVRSHAPVPAIDSSAWRLEIGGLVERPRSFSLEELARGFPRQEVDATLVCAGLRRDEFLELGPLPGELPWGPEPASTGRWTGLPLHGVLEAAGVRAEARYVEFTGLDRVERGGEQFGFGGSIDLDKAMSPDVLLATGLNGAPLTGEHGFPLRSLVPGWIGARSVKWLGRISLTAEPSRNYFQSRAYRFQRERNPDDPRDVTSGVALSEVPLNAVIVAPVRGQVIPPGPTCVWGWAMGGAGRPLTSVEVSADGGERWVAGRVTERRAAWTWAFWEAMVNLRPGRHVLVARAADRAGATQPDSLRATWNVKGYNNNAWHRVSVQVE